MRFEEILHVHGRYLDRICVSPDGAAPTPEAVAGKLRHYV